MCVRVPGEMPDIGLSRTRRRHLPVPLSSSSSKPPSCESCAPHSSDPSSALFLPKTFPSLGSQPIGAQLGSSQVSTSSVLLGTWEDASCRHSGASVWRVVHKHEISYRPRKWEPGYGSPKPTLTLAETSSYDLWDLVNV